MQENIWERRPQENVAFFRGDVLTALTRREVEAYNNRRASRALPWLLVFRYGVVGSEDSFGRKGPDSPNLAGRWSFAVGAFGSWRFAVKEDWTPEER